MVNSRVFAGNLFVHIGSRIAAVLIGLVSVGIISRTLGLSHFGEYTTALTYLQFFGVLVDFGLTITLVVMISEPGADEERIVGNVFTLRLLLGFLFYGIAPLVALALPRWSGTVHAAIAIGAMAYLLTSTSSVLIGIFQKHAAMWRAASAELLNRAALLAFIALAATLAPTVEGVMIATVLGNIVLLVATVLFARTFAPVRIRFDRAVWSDAAARSWPIALSTLLNLVYLRGDILFLSWLRSSAEVGVYGLAYRVIDVLTALPVMFMGLLLPPLVADWSAGRKDEFKAHLGRAFTFFVVLALPIMVGTQVVAEPLTELIAGEEYRSSGAVLRVLILAVFGVFLGGLYGHTVVALGKQRTMIWGYAVTAIISVIGYLIFIPPYGMWGAVWVTIATETLIAFLTFFVVYRTSGAWPPIAVLLKTVVASGVMYGALVLLPIPNVIVQIGVGGIVYGATMLLIGGIKMATIADLLPRNIISHRK